MAKSVKRSASMKTPKRMPRKRAGSLAAFAEKIRREKCKENAKRANSTLVAICKKNFFLTFN